MVWQLCDWTLVDIDAAAYATLIENGKWMNQSTLDWQYFCSILGSFGHSINVPKACWIIRQVVSGSIAIQIAWLSIAVTHNRATRNRSAEKNGFCFGYVVWDEWGWEGCIAKLFLESFWTMNTKWKRSQPVFTFIHFMRWLSSNACFLPSSHSVIWILGIPPPSRVNAAFIPAFQTSRATSRETE